MKTPSIMAIVALAAGLAGFAGCGDDGPEQVSERPRGGPGPAAPAGAVDPAAAEAAEQGRKNSEWDRLRDHFLGLENDPTTGFRRESGDKLRDPFEPQLVKYAKRGLPEQEDEPVVVAQPEGDAKPPDYVDNTPMPVALGPTQKYQVHDYRVLVIRWGTSVNKAVVEDAEGSTFVVTKDMKLGNKNGIITDITRYEVRVKEDDQDDEVVLSVEPPILAIREPEAQDERLFTNFQK